MKTIWSISNGFATNCPSSGLWTEPLGNIGPDIQVGTCEGQICCPSYYIPFCPVPRRLRLASGGGFCTIDSLVRRKSVERYGGVERKRENWVRDGNSAGLSGGRLDEYTIAVQPLTST
ncbi:hypothetical protein RRG08_047281 [Elysia crispata]|uniref:Uncharacterized protein n=1 Tax=Elysia crispata TaxID=231223 RepID=A0AAE0ZCH4_9GAST|nr:hypothetical protein RRG08_047281 [Elysia crispata]